MVVGKDPFVNEQDGILIHGRPDILQDLASLLISPIVQHPTQETDRSVLDWLFVEKAILHALQTVLCPGFRLSIVAVDILETILYNKSAWEGRESLHH
jgi:hypothetical protein